MTIVLLADSCSLHGNFDSLLSSVRPCLCDRYGTRLSSTRATVIVLFCTFSELFDIPVYWPILVIYFCILFALTMRWQIQHMFKYKYIPFDFRRKVQYGAK
ncbi:Rer1 family-domain-containing protein [Phellopilus nigrolimitatus]|nr:Rer1 family-domain-containing protein [Phellopilus nigrolimitatus]